MSVDDPTIIVALIAAISSTIAVIFNFHATIISSKNTKETKNISKAVRTTNGHTLAQVVEQNQEALKELKTWKDSYNNSPWRRGEGVIEWIKEHEREHRILKNKVEQTIDKVEKE